MVDKCIGAFWSVYTIAVINLIIQYVLLLRFQFTMYTTTTGNVSLLKPIVASHLYYRKSLIKTFTIMIIVRGARTEKCPKVIPTVNTCKTIR